MRKRRIAVVTDSLSSEFYFPKWYHYYARQFGPEALHVVTLAGGASMFQNFHLGAVRELAGAYDDGDRLDFITAYVAELLTSHDYVVRVDTDEFLIAEPREFRDLADYVDRLELPYVTARGFDIFEHVDERALQLHRAIIGEQRNHAFALTALCKTAITSVPLTWDRGFHMTSERPVFDSLYLMHMKRADVELQDRWNAHMARRIQNDPFIRQYYQMPRAEVASFAAELSRRPSEVGEDVMVRTAYLDDFLARICFDRDAGVWTHAHDVELVNVQIPSRFWHIA